MKFLADMGIAPRSVAFLRDLGVEAVHLHELGLQRLSDAEILQKARREGYVLLSHDLDFGELLAVSGAELPSVVIFRLKNMRPDNVNHYLRVLVAEHQTALTEGAIFSVSESRIRVRTLPIRGR
jgi:predicted nuclease of predicted toxin-antitoxin system